MCMYIYKHLNIYQNMFFLVAQKSSSLPYNLHHPHPPYHPHRLLRFTLMILLHSSRHLTTS